MVCALSCCYENQAGMPLTEYRGLTYTPGHKQLAPYPTVLQVEMKEKPDKAGGGRPKEELRVKPRSSLKSAPEGSRAQHQVEKRLACLWHEQGPLGLVKGSER